MESVSDIKKCPYCGQVCRASDIHCNYCGRKFPEFNEPEEQIDGRPISQIAEYVDKNSERYIKIFKKNEGRRIFTSFNWAAAFFGMPWFFYRKMYKEGIVSELFINLISLVMAVLMIFIYSDALRDGVQNNSDNYNIYTNDENIGVFYVDEYGNTVTVPPESETKSKNNVSDKINFWSMLISVFLMVLFGTFADCIYYNSVKKNVLISDGGVSVPSVFGALVIRFALRGFFSGVISFISASVLK